MAFSLTFKERGDTVQEHDFLLYIQGVDVSPYVQGSISWSVEALDGQNTLSCTLDNSHDRWVLTEANLNGEWRITSDVEFNENPKRSLYIFKNDPIRNPIDSAVTGQRRWQLDRNRGIFHKYDPIRMFNKDPYTPLWMPAFTGYLSRAPIDDDYINGVTNVQIEAVDIREPMDQMRIQLNPIVGLGTSEKVEPIFRNIGFFSDVLYEISQDNSGLYSNRYSKLKYENIISLLVTGKASRVSDDKAPSETEQGGVGDFSIGGTFYVEPLDNGEFDVWFIEGVGPEENAANEVNDDNKSSLEELYRIMLFGRPIRKGLLSGVTANADYWTKAECRIVGKETRVDGKFRPDNSSVYFVLPRKGTPWDAIVEVSKSDLGGQREWATRTTLVRELTEKVGYQWTVTPFGDMVFEFSQYDFLPKFYGSEFARAMKFDKHLISDNFGDEVGQPPAALVVAGGYDFRLAGGAGDVNIAVMPRAWIKSNVIAAKFGANVEQMAFPFTEDPGRLCLFAALEYAKRLADANELSFSAAFRPYLLPNRPMQVTPRERMATSVSVRHTYEINGEASTDVEVRYVRHRDKYGNYRLLTGSVQGPVSYANFNGIIVSAPQTEDELYETLAGRTATSKTDTGTEKEIDADGQTVIKKNDGGLLPDVAGATASANVAVLTGELAGARASVREFIGDLNPTIDLDAQNLGGDVASAIGGVTLGTRGGIQQGRKISLIPSDYDTYCENLGRKAEEDAKYRSKRQETTNPYTQPIEGRIGNAASEGSGVGRSRAQVQALADQYTDGDLEVFLLAMMLQSEDPSAFKELANVYFNQKYNPDCSDKNWRGPNQSKEGDPWRILVQNKGRDEGTTNRQRKQRIKHDPSNTSLHNAEWATSQMPSDDAIEMAYRVKQERSGPDRATYPHPADPTHGALYALLGTPQDSSALLWVSPEDTQFWVPRRCLYRASRRAGRETRKLIRGS